VGLAYKINICDLPIRAKTGDGREVAVKVFKEDPDGKKCMSREMRQAEIMSHP